MMDSQLRYNNSSMANNQPMKRQKKLTNITIIDNIDHISNLPNPILHHILSFLSTKEAVRTCILAKRWVDLWASLPSLVLDSDGNEANFEHFVNRFLSLRMSLQLDSFKILCEAEPKIFKTWLRNVVKLQPRSLYVVSSILHLALPGSVFRCDSLEELILDMPITIIRPVPILSEKSISFSHLKRLEIHAEIILDYEFMDQLMSGSVLLEELCLQSCTMNFLEISSDTLKHLSIGYCYQNEIICIHTPKLLALDLSGALLGGFVFKDMISLVTASIHFRGFLEEQDYLWGNPYDNTDVLGALSNVTHLQLHGYGLPAFLQKELLINVPICENLRSLYCWTDGTFYLGGFLKHTPNLENLTLYYKNEGCQSSGSFDEYYDSFVVPSFCCPYLDEIRICGDKHDVHKLVEQILASNENRDTKIKFV